MTRNRQAQAAARSTPHGTCARAKFDGPGRRSARARRRRSARTCAHCWANRSASPRRLARLAATARGVVPSRASPVLVGSLVGSRRRRRPARRSRADRLPGRRRARAASRYAASGCRLGEQPGRGAARSRGRPRPAGARGSCQPPSTSADAAGRAPARRRPVAPCRSTPPEPTSRSTSRRSLPLRSTTRPSGLTTTRERPACRRSARPTAARRSPRRRRSPVGRRAGSRARSRRRAGGVDAGRRARPASTVDGADQRMPRSPSTVRVHRVIATTSRAQAGVLRVERRPREWTSVVAPPTSTTTTSPAPGRSSSRPRASSSTPVSTTSGVAPRTIAVKSAPRDEVLAADHVGEEHLADRGPGAVRARARRSAARTLSASTCGTPAPRIAATSSRASTLPATTTGPVQPAVDQRRGAARRSTSALPPSVPPISSTTSGAVRRERARSGVARQRRRPTTCDDLAAAGQRDPAAGLGGDQLLVADDGDPQPAAGAGAGQHLGVGRPGVGVGQLGRGRRRTRRARRCSIVVGWLGRGDEPRRAEVDQRGLGERRAEVDAQTDAATARRAQPEGPVEVREQVVGGLDADARAGPGRPAPRGRCRRRDAWVIRPGCSISDSTPPSDSPSVKTSARSQTASACSSPPATRNDTMPPNRFICRGRDLVAGVRRAGPGRAPRSTVGWPARNVDDPLGVVAVPVHPHAERLEAAQHEPGSRTARPPRPSRSGGRRAARPSSASRDDQRAADDVGVAAAVLRRRVHDDVGAERAAAAGGTARRRCCRRRAARRPRGRPRRAPRCRRCRAAGWSASRPRPPWSARAGSRRATASTSATGGRACARAPTRCATLSKSRKVPPYASSGITTWSPGRHSARSRVSSAASPEANAKPALAPPRARRGTPRARSGSGWRERLYS